MLMVILWGDRGPHGVIKNYRIDVTMGQSVNPYEQFVTMFQCVFDVSPEGQEVSEQV